MRPLSRFCMSLDMLEKCQLVPVRIPSLFEQNVLKAVGGTQIEGSCKVYAGKTNWKTNWKLYRCSLASKTWGAIEAPWQMTPIRATFTCCKACDIVGEDEFALLASIPASFFSIKKQCMTRTHLAIFVDSQTEIGRTQNSDFLSLNIARRPHTTQSDLHLYSWTFLKLLTCLAVLTSSELLSYVQEAEMSIPTCSSENSQLVRTECLESSRRDTDRGKLQGVCGKD